MLTDEEKARIVELLRSYATCCDNILYKFGDYKEAGRDAEDLADKLEAELNVNKCGAV